MEASLNKNYILTVYAEEKRDVLSRVLLIFNKSGFTINYVNQSRTNISRMVLISLDVTLPKEKLNYVLRKIENIIEVHRAISHFSKKEKSIIAYYRVSKEFPLSDIFPKLKKLGATVNSLIDDSIILQAIGNEKSVSKIYKLLDGDNLLGFCKSRFMIHKNLELDLRVFNFPVST